MAKIHKLTKGGQTIYPATTTDAVVHPTTRKNLTEELSDMEWNIYQNFKILSIKGFINTSGTLITTNLAQKNYRSSDFINLDKIKNIVITNVDKSTAYNTMSFYSAEKAFISGINNISMIEINNTNFPEGSKFVRFSSSVESVDNMVISIYSLSDIIDIYNEINKINSSLSDTDFTDFEKKVTDSSQLYTVQGYINNNGELVATSTAQSNYRSTDYIPIDYIEQLTISGSAKTSVLNVLSFYDKSKSYISGYNNAESINVSSEEMPGNAKFIRMSTSVESLDKIIVFMYSLTTMLKLLESIKENRKLIDQLSSSEEKKLKWLFIGDSLTEAKSEQMGGGYVSVIDKTGKFEVTNIGVGGSSWISNFSFIKGEEVYGHTLPENFNLADYDIITIMLGTNYQFNGATCDFSKLTGDYESYDQYPEKFVYSCCAYLEHVMAHKKEEALMFVMAPPKWTNEASGTEEKQEAYYEELKRVVAWYSIPLIDVHTNCFINKLSASKYLFDKLHPNADGAKKIANVVLSHVKSWIQVM